jgi:hypothetical protein
MSRTTKVIVALFAGLLLSTGLLLLPGLVHGRVVWDVVVSLAPVGTVLITGWAVWYQVQRQWLLHSAAMVTQLVDRFHDSEAWIHRRHQFITMVLDRRAGKPVSLQQYQFGYGIPGFYENLAYLVKRGALDEWMVWTKFGWWVVCHYQLLTKGKDLIAELRHQAGDPTHYEEFEWLNAQMVRLFHEKGVKVFSDKGDVEWLEIMVAREANLEADTPNQSRELHKPNGEGRTTRLEDRVRTMEAA